MSVYLYPENWPSCPYCGEPALDGHLTCGSATCSESQARIDQVDEYLELMATQEWLRWQQRMK
jgi:hypothetical protein